MRAFSHDFPPARSVLLMWRRVVRHFKPDTVDPELLRKCLDAFQMAPSVGLSEPWRIVAVNSPQARQKSLENFKAANADALVGYDQGKAQLYASLKLTGMRDAPEQLAVFCEEDTPKGSGLGAKTMPEMRRYSVVSAIMSFWLAARAHGLGMGWVSILDPVQLRNDLDLPDNWSLVAYLCVGWPKEETETPELETVGWEMRDAQLTTLIER